jgi:hypothetical protein
MILKKCFLFYYHLKFLEKKYIFLEIIENKFKN